MTKTHGKIYKHIIWDWNGTLLDDVRIVVDAMNILLKRRNMPLLDLDKYKNFFIFPVSEYYARLGFDFNREPFEKLAVEYVEEFNSDKYCFKLHDGAAEVLKCIKNAGIRQYMLSASMEQELKDTVFRLGIGEYFVKIAGLNNVYAAGKVERGKELLAGLDLKPADVLLIGDTIHDYEVSLELGCSCLLVCNGHQSLKRLQECNVDLADDIKGVLKYLGCNDSQEAVI